jgi:hypothetical protein
MIEHLESVVTYTDYGTDFVDARLENLIDLSELEEYLVQILHLYQILNQYKLMVVFINI